MTNFRLLRAIKNSLKMFQRNKSLTLFTSDEYRQHYFQCGARTCKFPREKAYEKLLFTMLLLSLMNTKAAL